MSEITTVYTMTFDGGNACFDFINSGYDRNKGVITERLNFYDDLLTLVKRLALFDDNTLRGLEKKALTDENATKKALDSTRKIRTLLYRLFESIAQQHSKKMELQLLKEANLLFAEALQFKVLMLDTHELQFRFDAERAALMAPAWQFVILAYELLETGDIQFIRQCAGCAWLFLDKTKNHRKKWCSMESCGNREKTKKYYANKKS